MHTAKSLFDTVWDNESPPSWEKLPSKTSLFQHPTSLSRKKPEPIVPPKTSLFDTVCDDRSCMSEGVQQPVPPALPEPTQKRKRETVLGDVQQPASPASPELNPSIVRTTTPSIIQEIPERWLSSIDTQDPWVGQLVDQRFLLRGRWSSGFGCDTFYATDQHDDTAVWLKLFPATSPEQLDFFQQQILEKQTYTQNHPVFSPILTTGVDPTWGGYWTEPMFREHLWHEILAKSSGICMQDLLIGFQQICEALEELHAQGMTHGNIHRGGIFLSSFKDGADVRIRLADWGMASFISAEQAMARLSVLPPSSEIVWLPEWSQRRPIALTPAADIYRLGVVLFELLTGESPCVSGSPSSWPAQSGNRCPPSLRYIRPDIHFPASLEQLLAASLSPQPEDRPISAKVWLSWFVQAVTEAPTLWIPHTKPTPQIMPLDSQLRDAANELLFQCQLPTIRKELLHRDLFAELSLVLRTSPLPSLSAVSVGVTASEKTVIPSDQDSFVSLSEPQQNQEILPATTSGVSYVQINVVPGLSLEPAVPKVAISRKEPHTLITPQHRLSRLRELATLPKPATPSSHHLDATLSSSNHPDATLLFSRQNLPASSAVLPVRLEPVPPPTKSLLPTEKGKKSASLTLWYLKQSLWGLIGVLFLISFVLMLIR